MSPTDNHGPVVRIDQLLSPTEVAGLLAVTEHALAHLRSKGSGPRYVQFGRQIRYRAADVADYITAGLREPGARRSTETRAYRRRNQAAS